MTFYQFLGNNVLYILFLKLIKYFLIKKVNADINISISKLGLILLACWFSRIIKYKFFWFETQISNKSIFIFYRGN